MRTPDEIKRDLERQKTFSERLELELAEANKNIDKTLAKTYDVPENAITVEEITKISDAAKAWRSFIDTEVKRLKLKFKDSFDAEKDLCNRILNHIRPLFDKCHDYDFDGDEDFDTFDEIDFGNTSVSFTKEVGMCSMGFVNGLQIEVEYSALQMPIQQLLDLQKIGRLDKYVEIYAVED